MREDATGRRPDHTQEGVDHVDDCLLDFHDEQAEAFIGPRRLDDLGDPFAARSVPVRVEAGMSGGVPKAVHEGIAVSRQQLVPGAPVVEAGLSAAR